MHSGQPMPQHPGGVTQTFLWWQKMAPTLREIRKLPETGHPGVRYTRGEPPRQRGEGK